MNRTFLIIGLIVATGVVFKTLVVAKTIDQPTTHFYKTTMDGQMKLDASMVGIFHIGEETFFRDVNGHIGKAEQTNSKRHKFSRSYLSPHYIITWENGQQSDYSELQFVVADEDQQFGKMAYVMPTFVEEEGDVVEQEPIQTIEN